MDDTKEVIAYLIYLYEQQESIKITYKIRKVAEKKENASHKTFSD